MGKQHEQEKEYRQELLAIVMVVVGIVLLITITFIAITIALKVTKIITEPVKQIQIAAGQLRVGDLSHGDLTRKLQEEALLWWLTRFPW